MNVYNYTENNPVNNIDPIGLCEEKVIDWKCVDDCVWTANYKLGLLGIRHIGLAAVIGSGEKILAKEIAERAMSELSLLVFIGETYYLFVETKNIINEFSVCVTERCVISKQELRMRELHRKTQ